MATCCASPPGYFSQTIPPSPNVGSTVPGLVLYGDLSLQSGGFLYDRLLVERLDGVDGAGLQEAGWESIPG